MGITGLWRDEHGAELVEWVVLTLVVGLAGYAAILAARQELTAAFGRLLGRFVR